MGGYNDRTTEMKREREVKNSNKQFYFLCLSAVNERFYVDVSMYFFQQYNEKVMA